MTYHEFSPSVGQRLLWFLDRYRGDNGALNCPTMCRLRGRLDVAVLRGALDEVVARHESLRSDFAGAGTRLVQRVHDHRPVELVEVDLSGAAEPEPALRAAIAAELRSRIDPAAPLRVTLWRVADRDHVLCLNMHHLVTDSWSCGVVFQDLCAALDRASGVAVDRAEPGWQYREFVEWQDGVLSGDGLRAQQTYWHDKLAGMRLPELPVEPARPGGTSRQTALRQAELGADTVAALRLLARACRTTMFVVLLTVYYLLLYRQTGQRDLAVASLFANRPRREVRRTVGFLANMVILRTLLDPGGTVDEAVQATHATVTGGFLHQALPYQLLSLTEVRDSTRRPDDVVFQMLADPVYTTTAGGVEIEVLVPDGVGSRFELELVLVPHDGGMRVLVFFDESRLAASFADELVEGFVVLADAVSKDRTATIARLEETTAAPAANS